MTATIPQLTVFVAVAEAGSFSEAARRLGLSQPSLSRTVQILEQALGLRLFDRDTRRIVPTPAGLALQPIAERLIAEFDGGMEEFAQFAAGRLGRVTVAALPSIAATLLPAPLARFRAEAPQVAVLIQDGLSETIVDAVQQGRADFGLTIQPPPVIGLSFRPLVADEFGLVCRADDPLAAGRGPHPWTVFAGRDFIGMSPSSSVRVMTDAAFLQCGMAVAPQYECAFLGTTGHLVAAGLGITALPRLTMPLTAAPGLVWRRLQRPLVRRPIGIVRRAHKTLAPATRRLLELVAAEAVRNRPERQASPGRVPVAP
jgi:LysR family carnitine catabolism transcriptional activator